MIRGSGERGSAVVLAMVIVIIVVGISGAFLAETLVRSKRQHFANQADEAMMICDAVLEKTRRALWLYRDAERNNKTAFLWRWDDLLAYNSKLGCWMSGGTEVDPAYIKTLHSKYYTEPFFTSYRDAVNKGTLDQTTLSTSPNTLPASADTPSSVDEMYDLSWNSGAPFIGVLRPYGRGVYYVAVRDNDDGDTNSLLDTDNQLVVTVVARLPEGTQRMIEGLVEYPEALFDPNAGLISDGNVTMGNGDVLSPSDFTGPGKGKVHSNGDVDVGPNADATTIIAVGEVTGQPQGTIAVTDSSDDPPPSSVPIPDVDPDSFLTNPLFNAGGTDGVTMYKLTAVQSGNKYTVQVYAVDSFGEATGTSLGEGGWTAKANNDGVIEYSLADAATYTKTLDAKPVIYADGTLLLNAPGNTTVTGTFIATHDVEMGGNGSIQPSVIQKNSSTGVISSATVIAKEDIRFTGSSQAGEETTTSGVFLAGETATFRGNVNVFGSVIVRDFSAAGNKAIAADLDGNKVTITYSGEKTLIPLGQDAVKVKNVRRVSVASE